MKWEFFAGSFVVVLGLSWAATGAVLALLRRRAILDHPNERSSHTVPTPRGGGIAVVLVGLGAWAMAVGVLMPGLPAWPVIGAALALAALSWLDDLKGLSPLIRLGGQIAAVAVGLTALPADALIFQGLLPGGIDRLAGGLIWVWFVNLFNFMDGIDGIAAVETASIGLGLGLVLIVTLGGLELAFLGLLCAAAALGFLWWNWHPARIFLGDVGSVPLGFLLGWLLLAAAADGYWAAALILPLYYLADASLTLARRAWRGEKVWEGHATHFYQRALGGLSHAGVVRRIMAVNLGLIALAVVASEYPWAALGGASLLVAALLVHLDRAGAADAH